MNAVTLLNDADLGETEGDSTPEFEPCVGEATAMRSLRILLVDDEPSLREILAAWLEEEGHTVGTACDGVDGLEQFCSGNWDIVLVDRAMPRMNGFELAFAIKQRAPHMPVVMASGLPEKPSGTDGAIDPVDVCLRKPFGLNHLYDAIAQAMRIHSCF